MVIEGRATPEGTARYAARLAATAAAGHFRPGPGELTLSSIGLGTYLGEPDDATDALYQEAVVLAAGLGCNIIDTAINYRYQRSERAVGAALRALFEQGYGRDEFLVCTKGGFIPLDAAVTLDVEEYTRRFVLDVAAARREEIVAGSHILTPAFIRDQIEQSRKNLGLATIDLYYLHNPETQLEAVDRNEFHRRVRAVFETLETMVASGRIAAYGVATWDGFRVPPQGPDHLSLEDLFTLADEAAGGASHFAAVQLPFNLAMTQALTAETQRLGGKALSLLDAAGYLDVSVFASATLVQGNLVGRLPEELQHAFPGLETDAQRAIQFSRSVPGVQAALVGMKTADHVRENLAVAAHPPLTAEELQAVFSE